MTARADYAPGPARGAHVDKLGDTWTLVIVRELRHPPEKVWRALTEASELREWAPFDPSRDLDTLGPATLTTVGAPRATAADSQVRRVEPPSVLEYSWGEHELRWQLEPTADGTRLTLWHNIDRPYIAMGAAGWHLCLDVLDRLVGGHPLGRIVGGDAMKFEWKRLNDEYSRQFGIKPVQPPQISQDSVQ